MVFDGTIEFERKYGDLKVNFLPDESAIYEINEEGDVINENGFYTGKFFADSVYLTYGWKQSQAIYHNYTIIGSRD